MGLYEVSGNRKDYASLRGAAYRNPLAGLGFAVGSLSMVGFPMLSGFISKLLFATAALQSPHKMMLTLIGLAVSTVLNAIYFLRMVITLYTGGQPESGTIGSQRPAAYWPARVSVICFILLNLFLGLMSQPVVQAISDGLAMFD